MSEKLIYYTRYVSLILVTGYHLMELDMIKIAFPGILEHFGVIGKDNHKQSIVEFSKMYSSNLALGIFATLFWGTISDMYGGLWTSVMHIFVHIGITVYLAFCTDYTAYFYASIALSFFSNYTIALNTFMGWIPSERKVAFIADHQFWTSLMLQIAPIVGGFIANMAGTQILTVYHLFLAVLLIAFNGLLIFAFKDFKEEVAPVNAKAAQESEDLKGFRGFLNILKDKSAVTLLILGIYLRLVKKLVDVALHLWAEVPTAENGLGFDKAALGTYSTIGGIASLVLYKFLAEEKIELMPKQLKQSFQATAVVIFLFPFLALADGIVLNVGLMVLILVFNYCFSALFATWIGLLNVAVRKEIKSKSYAMTLAIRSIIGGFISHLSFGVLKWSLESQAVTDLLGGTLNSGCFFWLFSAINLLMYWYLKNLELVKKEKNFELTL